MEGALEEVCVDGMKCFLAVIVDHGLMEGVPEFPDITDQKGIVRLRSTSDCGGQAKDVCEEMVLGVKTEVVAVMLTIRCIEPSQFPDVLFGAIGCDGG